MPVYAWALCRHHAPKVRLSHDLRGEGFPLIFHTCIQGMQLRQQHCESPNERLSHNLQGEGFSLIFHTCIQGMHFYSKAAMNPSCYQHDIKTMLPACINPDVAGPFLLPRRLHPPRGLRLYRRVRGPSGQWRLRRTEALSFGSAMRLPSASQGQPGPGPAALALRAAFIAPEKAAYPLLPRLREYLP